MSHSTSSISTNVHSHSASLNRNNNGLNVGNNSENSLQTSSDKPLKKVAGYHCTLSHFITFKENKAHEIVGKSDFIASPIKYILPNENSSLVSASCKKQVKNLLKSGCVPRQDHGIFTFCEDFFEFVNLEWVLNCCDQAIQHLRFLIQKEKLDHPETLLCPITLSLFEEPVSDNHGHTFEKNAIEKQRQIKNECPMNRLPIISLVPNITVMGIIDDLQQKPLIPLLPSMVGKKVTEDNVKANRFLDMAKTFKEDGDYKEALEMYEKAFACINQYDDYEVIPDLYIKLNEPLKAALAYLYLVKKEIKNGQSQQILMTLSKLLRLVPDEKTILALQAFYIITQKDTAIAQEVFCTLALTLEEGFKKQFSLASGFPKPAHLDKEEPAECKTSEKDKASLEKGKEVEDKKLLTNNANPEKTSKVDRMNGEALVYWEYALNCNPKNLALYDQISSFVDDNTKTRLFLLGFFHHYPQDSKIAREFYEKAIALQPKNPLIYLAILSRLEKKDPEKIHMYRALAEIFNENKKHQKAIYFFNKILSIETNPDDIQKYIDYLYRSGNQENAMLMTLSHIDILCKNNETNILKAMEKFGRKLHFLEMLFNIYVQKEDLTDLEKLIPELASCYENELDHLTRIYRIAHEKLHLFDYSFKLGQILAGQNKNADSVRIFYDLYVQACKERDLPRAKLCEDELKKLNPVAYLSQNELQFLWTQTFPAQLSLTLANNHNETKLLLEQYSKSFNVLQEFSQQLAKNSEMLNQVQKSQSIALQKLEENVQEIKSTQQRQAQSLQELQEELLKLSQMGQETKKSLQGHDKSLQGVSTKVNETYALQTKSIQQLSQGQEETKKSLQEHKKSLRSVSTKVNDTYALQTSSNQQLSQLEQETKKSLQEHEKSFQGLQDQLQSVSTQVNETYTLQTKSIQQLSQLDQETKKSLQLHEKSLQGMQSQLKSVGTKVDETYALQTNTNQQLTQLDQETKKNFQIHEKSFQGLQDQLQSVSTKVYETYALQTNTNQQLTQLDQETKKNFQIHEKSMEGVQKQLQVIGDKSFPAIAFGKAKWEFFFGDIGEEPPLPSSIELILNGTCPIWPDKKVHETHLLTLIPKIVNGKPLNLKLLEKLVQKPLKGHATKYKEFRLGAYTDPSAPDSHWVLMSRDVIPESRCKSYEELQKLVKNYRGFDVAEDQQKLVQNYYVGYQVPNILDAAVSIFVEYVSTGARLYRDAPTTYTKCQEKCNYRQLSIGNFGLDGLCVGEEMDSDWRQVSTSHNYGAGLLRKM